jgi:hypothetical protein
MMSAPISDAIPAARKLVSIEWSRTFWPYEVRYLSRPRSLRTSGGRPGTPAS